ncbi:MAG: RecBCD enzyme subunit RecD [Deltaproteobacteria bacterium ADurb.Bin510]|nr:MAG: RecBCD enzyme subunit RecD [Deltaproteobacteria bacterium ADurb.Bin510]
MNASDWSRRFELLGRYRVLCAFNHGPRGTAGFNARIERTLAFKGLIRPDRGPHYHGRPIMVTCNDYGLGLYNGDIGLIMRDGSGALAAWFPAEDGARRLSLTRLPAHETVYAMTVHKSQGSEFDEVTLVLPAADSELLGRELIYTGLTRARQRLEIIGSPEILKLAVGRRVRRASGLAGALLAD